jgi:hypothetical protein
MALEQTEGLLGTSSIRREPGIGREMADLETSIEELRTAVDAVVDRFNTVMIPETRNPEPVANVKDTEVSNRSQIADRIRIYAMDLRKVTESLRSAGERCDL